MSPPLPFFRSSAYSAYWTLASSQVISSLLIRYNCILYGQLYKNMFFCEGTIRHDLHSPHQKSEIKDKKKQLLYIYIYIYIYVCPRVEGDPLPTPWEGSPHPPVGLGEFRWSGMLLASYCIKNSPFPPCGLGLCEHLLGTSS